MKNLYSALFACTLLWVTPVLAAQQSHAKIHDTALAYLQAQTRSLPGKVSIEVIDIDPRTTLRACASLEAYMPDGAKLIGKTSVGVRCTQQPAWSVFVQTNIRVTTTLLVANHPLSQNRVLSADDFSLRDGELGQPGLLTDPAQAIGKTLKFGIGAGQVLRQDMLRAPFVVKQGQTADVLVRSTGFVVRSSGQAINNGSEGQSVQVRMASGQVIAGIALADGSVEVRP